MGWIRSDNEWENVVKEANRRLDLLASYVKEKIFILHTFPFAYLNSTLLNNFLEKGTPINWTEVDWAEPARDIPKAQEKLDQIVSKCSKCEQIDYTPKFLVNGTFIPYDPQKIIPYVTQWLHLTQPGLDKIRPIYTDICNRIGKQ